MTSVPTSAATATDSFTASTATSFPPASASARIFSRRAWAKSALACQSHTRAGDHATEHSGPCCLNPSRLSGVSPCACLETLVTARLHRELHYWCWVNTSCRDRESERTVPANPKRTNMHKLKLRGLPLLLTRERLCRLRWLRCCRLWRKILRNSSPGPAYSHDYHDPEALRPSLHPSDFILAQLRKTKGFMLRQRLAEEQKELQVCRLDPKRHVGLADLCQDRNYGY